MMTFEVFTTTLDTLQPTLWQFQEGLLQEFMVCSATVCVSPPASMLDPGKLPASEKTFQMRKKKVISHCQVRRIWGVSQKIYSLFSDLG